MCYNIIPIILLKIFMQNVIRIHRLPSSLVMFASHCHRDHQQLWQCRQRNDIMQNIICNSNQISSPNQSTTTSLSSSTSSWLFILLCMMTKFNACILCIALRLSWSGKWTSVFRTCYFACIQIGGRLWLWSMWWSVNWNDFVAHLSAIVDSGRTKSLECCTHHQDLG